MTYATQQDLVDRFSETEIIQISDRGNVGSIDAGVVTKALEDADREINGYLESRYALPFANPPAILKLVASEIARYHLYQRPTEVVKERYEHWTKFLTSVNQGKVTLGPDPNNQPAPSVGGPSHEADDRVFTKDTLADFSGNC